jgi:hypothetical protein
MLTLLLLPWQNTEISFLISLPFFLLVFIFFSFFKNGMKHCKLNTFTEKDIFVDTMMVEELGLMPVDESDSPLKNGMFEI